MQKNIRRDFFSSKKIIGFIVVIFLMIYLPSCTSLKIEDFQNMSTEQRANFLCSRDRTVKSFQQEEANYFAMMNQINQDLIRGYKIHTQCREVEFETPTSVDCTSYSTGSSYNSYTNCQQNTSTSTEEECIETPVPLDSALEKQKLEQFGAQKQEAEKNRTTAYYNCYNKSIKLTAEEAYQAYRQ